MSQPSALSPNTIMSCVSQVMCRKVELIVWMHNIFVFRKYNICADVLDSWVVFMVLCELNYFYWWFFFSLFLWRGLVDIFLLLAAWLHIILFMSAFSYWNISIYPSYTCLQKCLSGSGVTGTASFLNTFVQIPIVKVEKHSVVTHLLIILQWFFM